MGGKTAPTANGYVISISLAGRISRGSREKVSIVKKNLIDFPWNQDPAKKNRIIIDVSRPRKTTALVSTTIYLGNLSPPFRHRYNNNTGEFIPFFVERNPPRYFNLLSSTSCSISARRHDTFAARRHLETFTHLRIPPRFYFIINDPCRWDRLGSNRFHAQAPSANVRLERNSVEVNSFEAEGRESVSSSIRPRLLTRWKIFYSLFMNIRTSNHHLSFSRKNSRERCR